MLVKSWSKSKQINKNIENKRIDKIIKITVADLAIKNIDKIFIPIVRIAKFLNPTFKVSFLLMLLIINHDIKNIIIA